ncbi:MAG: HAMP domain-containing sensor histidine kinase [Solirubrobacteraceae bacterium]
MIRRLSLRGRLLLATGAITLVALALADVAVYVAFRSYLYGSVDTTLENARLPIEAEAANPRPDLRGSLTLPPIPRTHLKFTTSLFCAIGREGAPGMFIEVRSTTGKVVDGERCAAYEAGSRSYEPTISQAITGFKRQFGQPTAYFTASSTVANGPSFRVRASRLPNGDLLIVAEPANGVTGSLRRLLALEALITITVLLAAVGLGRALVGVGLRPLSDVERTAGAISAGNLTERIPVENPTTEVGHLATALNVMLERIGETVAQLSASENRSRRFVADASHELRTPLAAVSSYAQAFKQGAAHDPEDLSRVMDGIVRESARMTRLVEDLLLLARLDEHELLAPEPVELVGLVAESIETSTLVGPEWPIRLDAERAVEVLGDRLALRQVIDNFLANVRAHTPAGTSACVRVTEDGGEAVIEVADNGPGLGAQDVGAVFDRFFRVDSSRTRATGGSGLGLAIVAAITAAHGGQVEVAAAKPAGTVFTVRLPLASNGPPTAR